MTPASGEGLTWNVAGLLGEDPGATREFELSGVTIPLAEELALAEPVAGHIRMRRTNRGILVDGELTATLETECSRCLRPARIPVDLRLDEEFLPALDIATGRPVPTTDEPEAARLTDHHEIDLEPIVRDDLLLAEPIAVLCRPDCPGLCPVCGRPAEEGEHDHPVDDIDPRLEALRGFTPSDD